ncbi:hypothetical protein ACA910_013996 [Epithemia clementina (nom. ined.)]
MDIGEHNNNHAANNELYSIVSATAEETALAATSDHELRVPCYCEENVWRLAYRKMHQDDQEGNRYWVVFISNAIKNVPMFQQRANSDPNKSVCWDYHVILLSLAPHDQSRSLLVYDVDSYLPYPCPLTEYLSHSFPYDSNLPISPLFRVVEADLFLQHFGSDRRHMYNPSNGTWKAAPPSYAPILSLGNHNLDYYLNFVQRPVFTEIMEDQQDQQRRAFGTIFTLAQLRNANFDLVA